MGVRTFYHRLEDQWYALLDRLEGYVPVYKVIDPIDEKIPSFSLVIGLILLGVLGLIVLPLLGIGGTTTAVFTFTDEENTPLPGVEVAFTQGGETRNRITNSVGKITLENIPHGSTITIAVLDDTFQPLQEQRIVTSSEKDFRFILRSRAGSALTFQLVDEGGQSLAGKTLTVTLSCTSGVEVIPNSLTVSGGVFTVTPPPGCERLVANVNGDGYAKLEGYLLSPENAIIRLQSQEREKGTLRVTVRDAVDNTVLEGMNVDLFTGDGVFIQSLLTNAFGVASFSDVETGLVYVSGSDPGGRFATSTSENISIPVNQIIPLTLTMGRAIQGTLLVRVQDKVSLAYLPNATVNVVRKSDNKVVVSQTTPTQEGTLSFPLDEEGPFLLTVSHPDYLSETQDIGLIQMGMPTIVFGMEKLTPQNSGRVTIHVQDEDGFPVDNAQVLLYDAASSFIAHQYPVRTTDANGNAAFTGVQSGSYFARATKYPAGPSDSPIFTSDTRAATQAGITLRLGTGTLEVSVMDLEGQPIPFATVEFLTDGTDECVAGACQVQTDSVGKVSQSFKADRKVFVRVGASGFATYASMSHQLYPGETKNIVVRLPTTILGDTPFIRLKEVRNPLTQTRANELKAGKTYTLVLEWSIPTPLTNLDKAGIHIRVGDEAFLENDVLAILSLNTPNGHVVKGTTYQPSLGFDDDAQNLTFGEAKWANAEWDNPGPGVYEIGVDVRISPQAGALTSLPIYYRGWAIRGSEWLRDPYDSALGTSASIPGKEGQYAETYHQIYFQGKPIVCDDLFCFSGEQLFNENDQLLVEGPPFTTQVNKSYDYSFVITSTSPTLYADPKLRVFIANDGFIPSGEVQLTGYEVVGTDGRVLRSTGLATNDVPGGEGQGLSVGTLEQYQTISGKVELLTKQDKATQIKVQLINEGEIVFEHTAGISIGKSGELRVTVDPSMAAAFIPTTFAITVTDDKGFDVQDAMVTLLKIDPSKHQQIISRQFTDIAGKTSLIGPPSLPRTRLVFDAVKAGLASQPITIIVDENVAFFDPATLSFQMPLTGDAEQFLPLRITNKTQQTLILMDARITGDFQGLLANGEMQNFVQQYANVTVIAPLETKTIQVKAATTPSAASFTGQTLRGSLLLTFATQDTQQRWVQQVPMTIALNVVGACDGEAIQFTGAPATGKIDTTAFDNKNQTQFQISNICLVDGQPYTLQNLKAKIVWTSNPIGNVELSTTDIGGSSQSSETLRSNAFVPLFGSFKPAEDTVYASVMTFTPFPQNIGNTAEFTIIIGAEIGSGNARRTIEKSFDVRVQITNLETCIVLDPEPERGIRIESEEDEARFTINTTNCGDVPVDILFCAGANNSNCSGGAPEGRLYLSQFSITDLKGSREITVERRGGTLPGTYDLTVDARVPGTSYKRVAALEVQVDSDLSYAFELDKGGFSLYQQDAKDATTVLNRLFLEQVRVKASICDWKDVYDGVPWDPKFWVDIHPLFGGKASAKAYQNVGAAAGAGAITYIIAAKYAASICAPCAAVIVAIAVLYSLFEDECDKDQTETLMDYIINLTGGSDQQALPPDAIDIRLSPNVRDHITGEWALDAAGLISKGEDTFQQAGVVFTNVSGYTNPNPLFGTVSLRALEHIHGDFAHAGRASVECRNGNFGNLRIGPSPGQGNCSPAEDRVREEKFHLKFRTQDINQSLPPLQFDSVACVSGNTLGQTGKGTLPRIALTWNWNDTTGIPLYACDAGNDQSIFCDATQFNIDLMKRVNAFQEFLSVNTFSFACPDNPHAQPGDGSFANQDTVPEGFIGFTETGYRFDSVDSITLHGVVQNNTTITQDVGFNGTMTPQDAEGIGSGGINPPTLTCGNNATIPAGTAQRIECSLSGVLPHFYSTRFDLTSTTTANIAFSNNVVGIDVASYSDAALGTCETLPKTTAILGGKPAINRWIDKDDPVFGQHVNANVQFTSRIPDVQTLNELFHFEAYLIRDGYSADFESDFREYYVNTSFADAPSWFTGSQGTFGLAAYYGSDDRLGFSNKYFSDTTLPAPGKYTVDVSVFFGEDWTLFDANGSPNASVGVDFYHLENPSPNSPFYKLPFDGGVGLQNTRYDRVGYGLEFINQGTPPIRVNDGLEQTHSGEGSTALAKLTVERNDDIRQMNSLPSTRGSVLEVVAPGGNTAQRLVFTPSLATPLMMKINHAASTEPFSIFYQLSKEGAPVQTGNNLTFWEGAGNCYDYTGVPVWERFNFTPDRVATPEDRVTAFPFTYGLDWENARVGGNEFLRTIFYTPTQADYAMQATQGNVQFITSNHATPSNAVSLDGITTLPYNNASTTIDSLQDVFDLVADQTICLADSGVKAQFFWNPEKLYKQTAQTSISALTNNLVAGQTCVGAPTQ